MRKPDEIMAEYLLKGGKMLSKTCPDCGSPLFEYKGTTLCVVCGEEKAELQKGEQDRTQPDTRETGQESRKKGIQRGDEFRRTLDDEFALTIAALLRQAREESDPGKAIKIMKAVKIAAEAYATLSH
jgi:UPF0148 protein